MHRHEAVANANSTAVTRILTVSCDNDILLASESRYLTRILNSRRVFITLAASSCTEMTFATTLRLLREWDASGNEAHDLLAAIAGVSRRMELPGETEEDVAAFWRLAADYANRQ